MAPIPPPRTRNWRSAARPALAAKYEQERAFVLETTENITKSPRPDHIQADVENTGNFEWLDANNHNSSDLGPPDVYEWLYKQYTWSRSLTSPPAASTKASQPQPQLQSGPQPQPQPQPQRQTAAKVAGIVTVGGTVVQQHETEAGTEAEAVGRSSAPKQMALAASPKERERGSRAGGNSGGGGDDDSAGGDSRRGGSTWQLSTSSSSKATALSYGFTASLLPGAGGQRAHQSQSLLEACRKQRSDQEALLQRAERHLEQSLRRAQQEALRQVERVGGATSVSSTTLSQTSPRAVARGAGPGPSSASATVAVAAAAAAAAASGVRPVSPSMTSPRGNHRSEVHGQKGSPMQALRGNNRNSPPSRPQHGGFSPRASQPSSFSSSWLSSPTLKSSATSRATATANAATLPASDPSFHPRTRHQVRSPSPFSWGRASPNGSGRGSGRDSKGSGGSGGGGSGPGGSSRVSSNSNSNSGNGFTFLVFPDVDEEPAIVEPLMQRGLLSNAAPVVPQGPCQIDGETLSDTNNINSSNSSTSCSCTISNCKISDSNPSAGSDLAEVRALFLAQAPHAEVLSVYRVENKPLESLYKAMQGASSKRNELRLWHGTLAESVENIVEGGFNRGYSGRHGTRLGKGTYFSADAGYSLRFCGQRSAGGQRRFMLMASVLVGDCVKGSPNLVEPPKKQSGSHERYDTTVDNEASPTVFCVFRDYQAMPRYVIEFVLTS